jgi:hypothetical protein
MLCSTRHTLDAKRPPLIFFYLPPSLDVVSYQVIVYYESAHYTRSHVSVERIFQTVDLRILYFKIHDLTKLEERN